MDTRGANRRARADSGVVYPPLSRLRASSKRRLFPSVRGCACESFAKTPHAALRPGCKATSAMPSSMS